MENLILLAIAVLVIGSFAWLFVFIVATFFVFFVGLILKGHPKREPIKGKAMKFGYILGATLLAIEAYFAVYPDDSFYFTEFKYVTDRKPPKDTVILFKDASYPDFHGDYCSFSRMQLSSSSYEALLDELAKDKRFKDSYPSASISDGYIPNKKLPELRVKRFFKRIDVEIDEYYEISFLEHAQIEVHLCIT